uniref:Secreted protein n=1 Tax=Anopheles dirus TaxID=7168 RepID=A0A182NY37_9DIPT
MSGMLCVRVCVFVCVQNVLRDAVGPSISGVPMTQIGSHICEPYPPSYHELLICKCTVANVTGPSWTGRLLGQIK